MSSMPMLMGAAGIFSEPLEHVLAILEAGVELFSQRQIFFSYLGDIWYRPAFEFIENGRIPHRLTADHDSLHTHPLELGYLLRRGYIPVGDNAPAAGHTLWIY